MTEPKNPPDGDARSGAPPFIRNLSAVCEAIYLARTVGRPLAPAAVAFTEALAALPPPLGLVGAYLQGLIRLPPGAAPPPLPAGLPAELSRLLSATISAFPAAN